MTAEAGLRARILAAIRQAWPRRTGVSLWGRPASAASGPGHPDIGGVVRSRPIALEIKKARGKPTPLQEQRIRDLRDCGCYAWIVRSPDEGVQAVYWTAKGWTRPLSNEPLDLNAWLNNNPFQAPAPEFAPAAEAAPEPSIQEQATADQNAFDLSMGYATQEPSPTRIPVESWDTPEHKEIAAQVLGFENAAQREAVNPWPKTIQQEVVEQPEELTYHRWGALREAQDKLDQDLRTVGDRITLIYERLDTYTAVLTSLHDMVGKIWAMIEVDEQPAPKPTRRRKKAEEPTPINGSVEIPAVPDIAISDEV